MVSEGARERKESLLQQELLRAEKGTVGGETVQLYFSIRCHASVRDDALKIK